jgi:hypothetical protein
LLHPLGTGGWSCFLIWRLRIATQVVGNLFNIFLDEFVRGGVGFVIAVALLSIF